MSAMTVSVPASSLSIPKAILWGGLIAGILDATNGVVAYGITGLNPIQVLQYIASGLLGASAFKLGLTAAAVGAGLHFLIAFVAAALYVLAARKISLLKSQSILFGALYGVAVFFFMNFVVLPNSAVAAGPFVLWMFVEGLIGHALFVGVPIALAARRTAE